MRKALPLGATGPRSLPQKGGRMIGESILSIYLAAIGGALLFAGLCRLADYVAARRGWK
jgi:hypothetical protein